jgi:hypothetical protein
VRVGGRALGLAGAVAAFLQGVDGVVEGEGEELLEGRAGHGVAGEGA